RVIPARQPKQFRSGLSYVRSTPELMLLFSMIGVFGLACFNFPIFTSTMSRIEFGEGAEVFGLMTSMIGIGSLAAAVLVGRRETPSLRVIVISVAGFGLAAALAAVMPTV